MRVKIERPKPGLMFRHVLQCIDGEKKPPKWFHRTSTISFIVHFGCMVFGLSVFHRELLLLIFCLRLAGLFVGQKREPAPVEALDEIAETSEG
jgi:hypothetical protein